MTTNDSAEDGDIRDSNAVEEGTTSSSQRVILERSGSQLPRAFPFRCDRVWALTIAIVTVGIGVSCAFVAFGLKAAKNEESVQFERRAQDLISSVETSWYDFEVAGLYVHNACRAKPNASATYLDGGICSRDEIDALYKTVTFSGLEVQAICWAINATHEDRLDLEAESYQYYAEKNLTNYTYNGFIGFVPDPSSPRGVRAEPSPVKDSYISVHYCLPYAGFNLKALDFDIQTSEPRRIAFENALRTRKPALTDRVVLLGDVAEVDGYSVIIFHPGNSDLPETPSGASLVVVRIRTLLMRATRSLTTSSRVVMFGTGAEEDPHFLGGLDIQVHKDQGKTETVYTFLPETDIHTIRSAGGMVWEDVVSIADRRWTIFVQAEEDLNIVFVVVSSVIIFTACLCLAGWYYTSARREQRMHRLEAAADAEKAALILENAEKNAQHERELNDFVAHEVRNPLAAALSAFSFVSTAINEQPPLTTEKAVVSVREDLAIIGSSLQYINDLLRNMIDMHKVASKELTAELAPTDIQRDLLDTVAAMLYNRGDNVEMIVECPENLAVMTDRIRLKQVLLNLTSNSRKFVIKGFIRIRVYVQEDKIYLSVEDSGPGIPKSKIDQLWNKYQESLDSLSQGTGIGLSLCKDLIQLMNGEIWLDPEYNSGIPGCPGARFVINLNASPLELHSGTLDQYENALSSQTIFGDGKRKSNGQQYLENLPKQMKIMFVDDDMILRKLFGRSVKRILPDWDILEAANGETALEMAKGSYFDIIFVDQYMASIEKQLLGTETVRTMRAQGVQSVICGLSANDVEEAFLHAGANCFMFKPFPCDRFELAQELNRVLKGTDSLCNTNADPVGESQNGDAHHELMEL